MAEPSVNRKPIQTTDLIKWKREGQHFAMLTAYDYSTACWLDQAGIPVLLVGDSLAGVILGHQRRGGGFDTVPVTLDDMVHHCKAVARGSQTALLVGDLPFLSYHLGLDDATRSAGRLMKEGGMQSVKLEGGGPMIEVVSHLVERGIPVMGHLGLTPQTADAMGGFRAQGRDEAGAARIRDALTGLEQAGAFGVVLEGMPGALAAELTLATTVPTIGIGAGVGCDGQVLVLHDMLGLTVGPVPRFVKRYAALGDEIVAAAGRFQEEVAQGRFPDPEHSYG
ncbi:MAG: 3-methyl-2-oxobutanoate hydroxymethyltransferase [Candidatus Dormibacteria bacterium]